MSIGRAYCILKWLSQNENNSICLCYMYKNVIIIVFHTWKQERKKQSTKKIYKCARSRDLKHMYVVDMDMIFITGRLLYIVSCYKLYELANRTVMCVEWAYCMSVLCCVSVLFLLLFFTSSSFYSSFLFNSLSKNKWLYA